MEIFPNALNFIFSFFVKYRNLHGVTVIRNFESVVHLMDVKLSNGQSIVPNNNYIYFGKKQQRVIIAK